MNIKGSLDRCDSEWVAGWVLFTDEPDRKAELQIYADDWLLGTCTADLPREDLVKAGIGGGRCAFNFRMPADLPADAVAGVVVRIVATDYLFRSGLNWVLHEPRDEGASGKSRKRFSICILHIGTEKTGTTTLQTFLGRNRQAFEDAGYFVPQSLAPYGEKRLLNHIHLAMYAMDDARFGDDVRQSLGIIDAASLQQYRQNVEMTLAEEIERLGPKCDVLILSNEHCHSRLGSPIEIQRLKRLLDPYCEQYEIVVYLRPQHELAMSQYGMFVANGTCNIDMLPPLPPPPGYGKVEYTNIGYFDYGTLLLRWGTVFGNESIHPRLYSKDQLRNGDIIDDFMNYIPMADDDLVRPEMRNTNVSEDAQKFLLNFYRHFGEPTRPGAEQVRERVRNALQKRYPGNGILPSRAAVRAFLELFRESNESVRRRWFPERAQLFDVDLMRFPETEGSVELRAEELYPIFIELLLTDQGLLFGLTPEQILTIANEVP